MSIPLEAHRKAQSSEIFVFWQKIKRAVISYLLANPAETAFLSFRDEELSNHAWLVQVRQGKVVVHTFLGMAQARLIKTAFVQELSKAITFFALGPILVKFHI